MTSLPPYIRIEPQNRNDLATIQCKPKINVITANLCYPLFDRKRTQSNSLVRKSISILTFCCIALVTNSALANSDRDALVALYIATNGPNWLTDTNWRSNKPIDEWYGVYTDEDNRVVQLFLNQNNLTGTIPPEIANLANLERIHLYGNRLTGSIPPEIGRLSKLTRLWLDENEFMGTIPPEIANLSNLRDLTLNNNEFRGLVPDQFQNLRLDRFWWYSAGLCATQSSGFDTWFAQIKDNREGPRCPSRSENPTWSALITLFETTDGENWNTNTNWFTNAPFSSWYGVSVDVNDHVIGINLSNNDLSGSVPSQLADISSLQRLNLSGNNITGSLPNRVGDLIDLEELYIDNNNFAGRLPSQIGGLRKLRKLTFNNNEFVGRIPDSFTSLNLERFWWMDSGVCVPDTIAFTQWLEKINDRQSGRTCPVVTTLEVVTGDAQSGTAGEDLSRPVRIRALDQMGNPMPGASITFETGTDHGSADPVAEVTNSNGEAQTTWTLGLGHINQTLNINSDKVFLDVSATAIYTDRTALEALHLYTVGSRWINGTNWGSTEPLNSWHGVTAESDGRVIELDLGGNGLRGRLPPALGTLSKLRELRLDRNVISGSIPSSLGLLDSLRVLDLSSNRFANGIPKELESLSSLELLLLSNNRLVGEIQLNFRNLHNLEELKLNGNHLSGTIPPSLLFSDELNVLNMRNNRLEGAIPDWFGNMDFLFRRNLHELDLSYNRFSGELPQELGELAQLRYLYLSNNKLSGSIPTSFSQLRELRELELHGNEELVGSLPRILTNLNKITHLQYWSTRLCAPNDEEFWDWFANIKVWLGQFCNENGQAYAYITQAIQSRTTPVPLILGESSLLRVFMSTDQPTNEKLPFVRARFFNRDGAPIYTAEIPPSDAVIPTSIDEGELELSANVELPAFPPGWEMVIEIDPFGRLPPEVGIPRRIPRTGRIALSVENVPQLRLYLVPLVHPNDTYNIKDIVYERMHSDSLAFRRIRDALPVRHFSVHPRAPLNVNTRDSSSLLRSMRTMYLLYGWRNPNTYAMGIATKFDNNVLGRAILGGNVSVSEPFEDTMSHELGHNFGLEHAPWKETPDPDPYFPNEDGSIGAWGYDPTQPDGMKMFRPTFCDLMGYCGIYAEWISPYNFNKALRFRQARNIYSSKAKVRLRKSLLISGTLNSNGELSLDPAFAVNTKPSPPDSHGPYTISGRSFNDVELFSFSFDIPQWPDGDGSSGFAFVLPIDEESGIRLNRITVSGPNGYFELRDGSKPPTVIARDYRSGEVRAILTNLPDLPLNDLTQRDFDKLLPEKGLDVMVSRGIPSREDWLQLD